MISVRNPVEDMLGRDFVIAAEVGRLPDGDSFVLLGLFFPVDYATGDEWAADQGVDEIRDARLAAPVDWMSQQEARGVFVAGTYPVEPDDLRFWGRPSPEQYFVTLEVTAREFLIVRHIAASVRAMGMLHLIGEDTSPATGQTED